jgi:sulfite dehydrogenase (cytochrome) subunit B
VKQPRAGAPATLATPALLALAGACAVQWALAAERTQLNDGAARDLTVARCIVCHSVEYIPSNAPAMNRAAWQKTIQKMKDRFGAPITDEEAKQILDYLDANYSGRE